MYIHIREYNVKKRAQANLRYIDKIIIIIMIIYPELDLGESNRCLTTGKEIKRWDDDSMVEFWIY